MSKIENLIHQCNSETLTDYFRDAIPSFKPGQEDLDYLFSEDYINKYEIIEKIGDADINGDDLIVISSKTNDPLTERTGKKNQYEIAKKILKEEVKDAAIFVFYDEAGSFRFSFVRANYQGTKRDFTDFKRYTYYVDPNKNNKTFRNRLGLCSFASLDKIQEAFSVEQLSKEFYKELSHWYFAAMSEIDFPNDIKEPEESLKANSLIRLITRLIFVWFMKQKGIVPDELFDFQELKNLLNFKDKTQSTYYKAILQNLFFATLSTPMGEGRKFVSNQLGVQNFYRYSRFISNQNRFLELMDQVPFLNGGLFESLDIITEENGKSKAIRIDCFSDNAKNETRLKVPDYLFFGTRNADLSAFYETGNHGHETIYGIIDLLKRYDFTIDENTANDQEVALDPELLGLVFENLLASYNPETQNSARKESGSFYTPRPIVDYMAEESLAQYLHEKTNLDLLDLRKLLAYNEEQPFDKHNDKVAITSAISQLKILDPACGSGAFPMGILLKMVHALSLLDPDNTFWRQAQIDRLKNATYHAFEKKEIEDIKKEIDSIFNNELNDADYARKLYLIEDCIYGVDIQPIAMQISKLRFFISLLVEQQIDKSKNNFGILALPNLETKFVAANSLIQPHKPEVDLFTNQELLDKQEELKQCRHRLFSARSLKTKKKYRALDSGIRKEMAEILEKSNLYSHDDALQFAQWDPYLPDSFSPWFDPEWMFGLKGFDIVIGNPPYIQLQKVDPHQTKQKYADGYKDQNYKTFERTGDIYALFYERGLQLLQKKGVLCYITSNKWMRAKYGTTLRNFLSEYQPLILIDMGPGVFDAATVDVNILIVEKSTFKKPLLAYTLNDKNKINDLHYSDFDAMNKLDGEAWIILSPVEKKIKEKIERIGTPLKNWDVKINRGILTGYNEAFIIDGKVKDQLIAEDPNSADIIKPILRGRDIQRYHAEFADKWLIATLPSKNIKIAKYPAIQKYLNGFKPKLNQTGSALTTAEKKDMVDHAASYGIEISFKSSEKARKKTSHQWFETQDPIGYWEEFEKKKIVWAETIKIYYDGNRNFPRFLIENEQKYLDKTCFFLIAKNENINSIIGQLNSKLFEFYLLQIVITIGSASLGLQKNLIQESPVCKIQTPLKIEFEDIISNIQSKKERGEDTTAEEQQIDLMVYKLYELSYEEVKIVDPDTPFSKEAYDNYRLED